MANNIRATHIHATSWDQVTQAIADGIVDAYDVIFLTDGSFGWVDRNMNIIKMDKCNLEQYSSFNHFPQIGQSEKLYIDSSNSTLYTWSKDNGYQQIGTGSANWNADKNEAGYIANKPDIYTKDEIDELLKDKIDQDQLDEKLSDKVDKDTFDEEISNKVNADDFENKLSEKLDKDELDEKLSEKVDKNDLDEKLADKVDKDDFDEKLNEKLDKEDFNNQLDAKADKDEIYTKDEIDSKFDNMPDLSDLYTNEEIDNMLAEKADSSDVYTKTQTDSLLDEKANASDIYSKSEIDDELNKKANSSDVYDKSYIDSIMSTKVGMDEVNDAIKDKADVSYVDEAVSGKANSSDVEDALSQKADLSEVNQMLSTKVDKVDGKQLSTEDFTTAQKEKLDEIEESAQKNVQVDWNETNEKSDAFIKNKPEIYSKSVIDAELENKVDAVEGKGLSENDFTDELKDKLENIEDGAEKNQNSFSRFIVNGTTISAGESEDAFTIVEGDNITISTNADNKTITISATSAGEGPTDPDESLKVRIGLVEAKAAEHDTKLDAQADRLDAAETNISNNATDISNLSDRVDALENVSWVPITNDEIKNMLSL